MGTEPVGRIYLYGIVDGANEAALSIPGVEGDASLRFVAWDGLGCLVSDYDGEELGSMSTDGLVRRLLAHQRTVERAMACYTVLPVKFGALLNSPQEVLDLLSQAGPELAAALAVIRGKVEMEVAATWDVDQVLQEVGREEAVVRLKEALLSKGQPTLEERAHLGQVVKANLDRRRESYRERMMDLLSPLAVEAVPNALLSDRMVMNVAFLIERAQEQEFDQRVQRLDDLFGNRIAFRVVGPLPPYSFSTVEVRRLTPAQMEEARQTLDLGDGFSEAVVRRAYRRLAAEAQAPSAQGGDADKARFTRLRQSADLLLSYLRSRRSAQSGELQPVPGDRWVVAIRRSRGDEVESARFGGGGVTG